MVESKIEEIFNDAKTIYFFDIDGVLIRLNLGEYTHYFYAVSYTHLTLLTIYSV